MHRISRSTVWFLLLLLASLALVAIGQSGSAASHSENFQSYGTQKNPPGWTDSTIWSDDDDDDDTRTIATNNGGNDDDDDGDHDGDDDDDCHDNNDNDDDDDDDSRGIAVEHGDDDDDDDEDCGTDIFRTWGDPTQSSHGPNVVFGAKDPPGKLGGNPRVGAFSTYTKKTFSSSGRFEYRGRFLRTNSDTRLGLTFFSGEPGLHQYYLLGLWKQASGNKTTMQLFAHGAGTPTGKIDSVFTPETNKWYSFIIRVEEASNKTNIRAKVWLATQPEPTTWSIDASDGGTKRLKSGRIGVWAAVKGGAYFDDLNARSPIDLVPPTIQVLVDGAALPEGKRYNKVIAPKIVVTDDGSATYTAKLDGQNYVSETPITGQGSHTLTVHAVDNVGNTADATLHFSIDTLPPAVTIVTPQPDSMTKQNVTVALQVVDDSLPYTVEAWLNDQPINIANAITAEGRHKLVVKVTDAVGLSTTTAPRFFTIDRTPPTYVLKDNTAAWPADGFIFNRNVIANLDYTDLTPVTINLILDGAPFVRGTTITEEKAEHILTGTLTDAVGNVTTVTPRKFGIDKTAPEVTVVDQSNTSLKTYYDDPSVTPTIRVSDITTYTLNATLNGQPFNSGTALTAEGKYTLAGRATDAVGHTKDFGPIVFYIDRSDPQIALTANAAPFPASGHVFNQNVVAAVQVSDLTLRETTVTLNGASVELPLTIEDGVHTISATATDGLMRSKTAGPYAFTIDTIAPAVTVTAGGTPLGDTITYFNTDSVTPLLNVVDATTTNEMIHATLNGQPFTSGTVITAEGTYVIAGTVTDAAQHNVTIGPARFVIDRTPPTGVFKEGEAAFPAGQSVNRDVKARVVASEPLSDVDILLDGDEYIADTPITTENAHTLRATLVDLAGNPGTVPEVSFRIDRTPPVVSLQANGNELAANDRFRVNVTLDANVIDKSTYTKTGTLTFNGGAPQTVSLPRTVTADGNYTFTATATDAVGLSHTPPALPFLIDTQPATVAVLLNGQDAQPNQSFNVNVAVTLRVLAGASGYTAAIRVDGTAYTEGTPLTADKRYEVTGTVTTGTGVQTPIPPTVFFIDKTPPTVTLLHRGEPFPASTHHFNADVIPSATCSEGATCDTFLRVNGVAWQNDTPISTETPRPHTIEAWAIDKAGNRGATVTNTFILDKTPPVLTITSHTDRQVLGEPRVVLAGGSDDALSVAVNGVQATVDLSAKTYVTPQPITLTEGDNIITVLGIDEAGNPGTTSIHLFVDTRGPELTIASPQPGACLTANDIVVQGSANDPTITSVRVSIGAQVQENVLEAGNQAFTATFTGIAEGTQTITVEAKDIRGHRTVHTLQVFVDRQQPVIQVLESGAAMTSTLFNRPIALVVRANDLDPNVRVTATLNNQPYLSGTAISTHGLHHLGITAVDCAGNQVTSAIDFEIDLLAPIIEALTPPNGATIGTIPQSITGKTSVDAVRVEIESPSAIATLAPNGDFTFNGLAITEGTTRCVLRATDAAGNTTRVPYAITVKSTAPTVEILEGGTPLINDTLFNRPVVLSARTSDPSATLTIRIGGSTYDGAPVTADGTYTVVAEATNEFNNSRSETRTFRIDRTPPAITITSPLAGIVTNEKVDVTGSSDDATSISVNGFNATITNGTYRANAVPLEPGENLVIASGADLAGNVGRAQILVDYSGAGPGIILTTPADGMLTNRPRIDVVGHVLAQTIDGHVIVGSTSVPVDADGAFRLTGYQLTEGENVIVARAIGLKGQEAATTVRVNADFTPPAVTILAAGEPLIDGKNFPTNVSITLRAVDDRSTVTSQLSVDGSLRDPLPVLISAQGGHVLTAVARDQAGNETRVDRTFFIGSTSSTEGCVIESIDPADGSTVLAGTVRVAGRVVRAVTMTIAGVSAQVADNTYTATITLPSEGANRIDARCTDASNKLTEKSFTLHRVTGAPSIDITQPTENFVTAAKLTTVSGTVSSDATTVDVNGVPATVSGTGTTRTFVAENVPLVGGVNVLAARARNDAGRMGSDSVRGKSLQTLPTITITSPLAGTKTGAQAIHVSGVYTNLDPTTLTLTAGLPFTSTIESTRLSDTTGSFIARNVPINTGDQTIRVEGRDAVNRSASATVAVTSLGTTAPSIAIATPADNSYHRGNQPIAVTGTFANGGEAPRVDVNGGAAEVDTAQATYTNALTLPAAATTPVLARLTVAEGEGAVASIRVHRLSGPLTAQVVFPTDAAEGIDPSVMVLIAFNGPLDRSTLNGITLSANGSSVTTTAHLDDTIVTLVPTALLQPGLTYTVRIATTVADVAGNTLANEVTSTFSTGTTASATAPSVDVNDITGCPTDGINITGTATPFARLRVEGGAFPRTGTADSTGKFKLPFTPSGRAGYQIARVYVVGADGTLSPPAEVSIRIDCLGPSVVGASYDRNTNALSIAFSKPVKADTLIVGETGSIVLIAEDDSISAGTVSLNGSLATVTPATDLRQATFTLDVLDTITDPAGNKLVAPHTQLFSITGDETPTPGDGSGFISGEVYDASTGQPLDDAQVSVIVPVGAYVRTPNSSSMARYTIVGGSASSTPTKSSTRGIAANADVQATTTTRNRGRYTIQLAEGAHTIEVRHPDYTNVWRQIIVPAGAGVVPIDIRMTKRAAPADATGGALALTDGGTAVSVTRAIALNLPAASIPPGYKVAFTSVGAQSIAGLLPLGWSPLASAEIAVFGTDGKEVDDSSLPNAELVFTLPSNDIQTTTQTLSLVQYESDRDEWRTLIPVMSATSGDTWKAIVTSSGAYAVVYRDKGATAPPVPTAGTTLRGHDTNCMTAGDPCALEAEAFTINPNTVAPAGRAVARLTMKGALTPSFPSGTAVQAYVSETLRLSDGRTEATAPFAADVLLYRNLDGTFGLGEFMIAPSRAAQTAILNDGVDHVQILRYPGRLDRGTIIGSEGGRIPGDDRIAIEIPSGATTEKLHASVASIGNFAEFGTIAGYTIVGGFTLTLDRVDAPPAQDNDGDGTPDPVPAIELLRAARATLALDTTTLPRADGELLIVEVAEGTAWGRIFRLANPLLRLDASQPGVPTVRFTTRTFDGNALPVDGLIREGRYLVLAANEPIAWATGSMRLDTQPLGATRILASATPAGTSLGVLDVSRATGVFALPVPATPAAGFRLTARHATTGEGRPYDSTTPPPADTVVNIGNFVMTVDAPQLQQLRIRGAGNEEVIHPAVAQIAAETFEIVATFNAPIDSVSAQTAFSITNTRTGAPLGGVSSASGNIVTFRSTGTITAGTTYSVILRPSVRGTNGAAFGQTINFSFSTDELPADGTIRRELIHITLRANNTTRIYGDPDALPANWRVLPLRRGRALVGIPQATVNANGSFSLVIGSAADPVTIDDVIDLQVINNVGGIAAIIRLTPFVSEDGLAFVAPVGLTTTFTSAQGVTITVPAGAFDRATLVRTTLAASPAVFADIPNFANEINVLHTIELDFEGSARQGLILSLPISAGTVTEGKQYMLGWKGDSARGPRMAFVDLLNIQNGRLTNAYPPDENARRIATLASGFPYMQIAECMLQVKERGAYATANVNIPASFGLGFALISELSASADVMSNLYQSIYLPDFAFRTARGCVGMPILKGREFTLSGFDTVTGLEVFKKTYAGADANDPSVIYPVEPPMSDLYGPYPVFGSPFRMESFELSPTGYAGRGFKATYDADEEKVTIEHDSTANAGDKFPEKTLIRYYNATRAMLSAELTVSTNGFSFDPMDAQPGDRILLYVGARDVAPDVPLSVVFTEPVYVGNIPTTATAEERAVIVNTYLRDHLKLELEADSIRTDLTTQVIFGADSQNRRITLDLPGTSLVRGGAYHLTLKATLADKLAGNNIFEQKDMNGDPVGNAIDVPITLHFKVRDDATAEATFTLRQSETVSAGGVRDMAKYGNIVFVSALDGGVLAYDLSDPAALQPATADDPNTPQNELLGPLPMSLVTANWEGDGGLGLEQHWAVTADHHGRVYSTGFTASLSTIRSYRVEDFLAARDENPDVVCTHDNAPKNSNCRFYGAAVIGFRPGFGVTGPTGTGLVYTNQPLAYPRKVQIIAQDDTVDTTLEELMGTTPPVGMTVLNVVDRTGGMFSFDVKLAFDPAVAQYLSQRVTLINRSLDMRWSTDVSRGDTSTLVTVFAHKKDKLRLLRNRTTYAVITQLGYGVGVYDFNGIETNDFRIRCGEPAFALAHPNACANSIVEHITEFVINTPADARSSCTPISVGDGIQNVSTSPDIVAMSRTETDPSSGLPAVTDEIAVFGLEAKKGVLDFDIQPPLNPGDKVPECVTRSEQGLLLADHPALASIKNVAGFFRMAGSAAYHWELSAADNLFGARGSKPGTDIKRDYLLLAGNNWGLIVVEVAGTAPQAIPSYRPLKANHVVDVIWSARGITAVRIIEGTDLAVALDREGHLLIIDLAQIDERWTPPNGVTPSTLLNPAPFPIPTTAMNQPSAGAGAIGVDDPRIVYKSDTPFTTGVIAPFVDPSTGIAFGGNMLSRTMRIKPVLDPKIEFLVDLGEGLQPAGAISPLGVPQPLKNPMAAAGGTNDYPAGSLAAFRVSMTLPASMNESLPQDRFNIAVESERIEGVVTAQTPGGLPRAHLRNNDRDGKVDPRKLNFTMERAIPMPTNAADAAELHKKLRHQRGYNKFLSPWIVAIADPRASERVVGTQAEKEDAGCKPCMRPTPLQNLTPAQGVHEIYTAGRFLSVRADAAADNAAPSAAMPGFYDYLTKNERLVSRVPTTIADTVRPKQALLPANNRPAATGEIGATTFVHSGEIEIGDVDLTLMGRGDANIALSRTYRSRTIGGTVLGLGWESSLLRRLRQLPDGKVEYRDGSGDVFTFEPPTATPATTPTSPSSTTSATSVSMLDSFINARFTYKTPKGLFVRLVRADGGWTMMDSKWRITGFDALGRLVSESDEFWKPVDFSSGATASGNLFRYYYDREGRMSEIVDPVGRSTKLTYYENNPTNANCTEVGVRTNPCAFAGYLKQIEDWRKRTVVYEYDKVGRLLAVQLPTVGGATGAPADVRFDSADRKPRIRYKYAVAATPPAENASDEVFTDFLELGANVQSILDPAAEYEPSIIFPPPPPTPRVTFEYFPANDTARRDHVRYHRWPCGNRTTACSETSAEFKYPSTTTAEVIDMLGQTWKYDLVEADDKYKHLKKVTAVEVPTVALAASATTVPLTPPTTPVDHVTEYIKYDEDGLLVDMKMPNGRTIHNEIERPGTTTPATATTTNPIHCKRIKEISEVASSLSRVTKFKFETAASAICTATEIGRDTGSPAGFVYRDAQSASRDRLNVTKDDSDANIRSTVEHDAFGRSRKFVQSPAGGGAETRTTFIDYIPNDAAGATNINKGRPESVTGGGSDQTHTTYRYAEDGVQGQKITVRDEKRNITTVVTLDSWDREIERRITDATNGLLLHEKRGYDANGDVAWTSRAQSPIGDVETFTTLDPLGRVISVRSTGNQVMGGPGYTDLTTTMSYDLTNKRIAQTDPSTGSSAPSTAENISEIDFLGRTVRTERKADVGTGVTGGNVIGLSAYDINGAVSYTSDSVLTAGMMSRDGFGRLDTTLSRDGLRTKSTWNNWDELLGTQGIATDGSVFGEVKNFYTEEGRLRASNTGVVNGGKALQSIIAWTAGGREDSRRVGAVNSIDTAEVSGPVRATQSRYDDAGLVKETIVGEATGTFFGFNREFHRTVFEGYIGTQPTTITDIEPLRASASRTTTITLDGLDRVRTTRDENGLYETESKYDEAGNVTSAKPSGLDPTAYTFDARGLALTQTKPGFANSTITRHYDALGVLRLYKDEENQPTTYSTDGIGRVIRVDYPDTPANTYELFDYEPASGALRSRRNRDAMWLFYSYDTGGRPTEIHSTLDPAALVKTLETRIEYDVAKRIKRVVNKDSAVEYEDYDLLGRPGITRTIRYANGTGLETNPTLQVVSDRHVQKHTWTVFSGERATWTLPVPGSNPGASNGPQWRTEIIETRDGSGNIMSQTAGAFTITLAAPAGPGQLKTRERGTTGTESLHSHYGYADTVLNSPIAGDPNQGKSGALREMKTTFGAAGHVLAGSEVYRDKSHRARTTFDHAFTDRASRWIYDERGRLQSSQLLAREDLIVASTPVVDVLNGADFRSERVLTTNLGTDEHALLGTNGSLVAEPAPWVVTPSTTPAHQLTKRELLIDGMPGATKNYTFIGGRRITDGTWDSTFDALGRMTAMTSATRRIEYTYDPNDRIVGRAAMQPAGSSWILETRADLLAADGLPAATTFVWDPVVDRLVAIYEAGATGAPEAGLLRQYVHGDRGYDDLVEALVRPATTAAPKRFVPIFDEAATGSLQAVADDSGRIVERVLYADSYGDAPRYLHGPVVDLITLVGTSDTSGNVNNATVRVRLAEPIDSDSLTASTLRVAAIASDNKTVLNTFNAIPTLVSNGTPDSNEIELKLTAAQWAALIANPDTTSIEVAVSSSLRGKSWIDTPPAPVPAWSTTVYGARSDASFPVKVVRSISSLTLNGTAEALYEVESLYAAASRRSVANLLTAFHGYPFIEPASDLVYVRARWYDAATGTWLSPDSLGYQDSSNLYAFVGGDPVNGRDPQGLADETNDTRFRLSGPTTISATPAGNESAGAIYWAVDNLTFGYFSLPGGNYRYFGEDEIYPAARDLREFRKANPKAIFIADSALALTGKGKALKFLGMAAAFIGLSDNMQLSNPPPSVKPPRNPILVDNNVLVDAAEKGDVKALDELRAGKTYVTPNQYREFMNVKTQAQRKARAAFLRTEGIELISGERAAQLSRTDEFRRVFAALEPVMGRDDAALAAFAKATGYEAVTKERRLFNFLTKTLPKLAVPIRRLIK